MKKISLMFLTLLSVLLLAGCQKPYDDTEIKDSIESLQNRMDAMEKVLKAYESNLFIVSVTPTDNGYLITFSDGSKVEVAKGSDDQNASGNLIKDIVVGENEVTFILTDGTSFSIPMNHFDIVLGVKNDRVSVSPGDVVEFSYELLNASDKAVVTVSSDGIYKVKVVSTDERTGYITVTCPDEEVNGYINVFAVDNGYTIARVIRFTGGDIEFNRGSDYTVAPEGRLLDLPFKVSFDYEARVDEASASWISVVETKASMKEDTLYLQVAPNAGETERVGKVYVYEKGFPEEIWSTLTITQGVAAFSFEVEEVTETYLRMNVVPKDKNMTYLACISPSDQVKYLDDYELYYEQIKIFEETAQMQSSTLEKVIEQNTFRGRQMLEVGGLIPGREYTCYVFGLDAATAEMTSTMSRYDIATVSVEMKDIRFDVNTVVDEVEMTVTITPEDYDGYYFTNVLQGYDESVSQEEVNEVIITNWIDVLYTYMVYEDMTVEQAMERLCAKGERTLSYTGARNTLYAPFAVAINEDGMVCSDVSYLFVKTQPVKPSGNILTISAENVKARSMTMKITTTNDDPYVFFIAESAVLENLGLYSDEDILDALLKQVEEDAWVKGDFELEIGELLPETEYRLFAFGFDSGYATTALFQTRFETRPNVDSDVRVWVEYGSYYDAMAVGQLDPTYKMMAYPGAAFLPVVPKSEPAGYTMYYSFFYSEDLVGVSDNIIKNILVGEVPADYSVPFTLYMPDYGTEIEICAVGQDAEGNLGDLWIGPSVLITEDGVSDPAEFVEKYPWPFSAPAIRTGSELNDDRSLPYMMIAGHDADMAAAAVRYQVSAEKGLLKKPNSRGEGEISILHFR